MQESLESRYGYIHRDIKPENVIVNDARGPVLIDFNISVRVSTPVLTISATPGYLPPTLIGTTWSPRIDLYQLGITLLQVAAGDFIDESNRDDLVTIMRSTVSPRTATFIEKLVKLDDTGYRTAFVARRDAQRLRDEHVGS